MGEATGQNERGEQASDPWIVQIARRRKNTKIAQGIAK